MTDLSIALVAVFISVSLVVGWTTSLVLARRSPTRRRLAALAPDAAGAPGLPRLRLASGPDPALKRLAAYIPKSPAEMTRIQRKLAAAGYHGTRPTIVYCAAEVALALTGFLTALSIAGTRGLAVAGICAVIGYMAPGFYVSRRIAQRRKAILNGLPDALDLLIVCIEAGLGIDHAMVRTGEELRIAHPALSEELRMVNLETRAGKPRIEALKNLAGRIRLNEIRGLVAMLVQTDRFGTSLAQALRTHAETSRTRRRQRAEERAAKLGVKLVFPLVFCLLPAFFVVGLGPAIITLLHFLGNNPGFSQGGLQ
jgi:tight adherence protein C